MLASRTVGFYHEYKEERNWALEPMNGAIIASSDSSQIHFTDTLFVINKKMDISPNVRTFRLNEEESKIYCCKIAIDTVSMCDLSFYEKRNGALYKIQNVKIKTEMISLLNNGRSSINDFLIVFFWYGYNMEKCKKKTRKMILLDLGKLKEISAISYIPYTKSTVLNGNIYRLYFWNNGWQFFGEKEGTNCDF